MSSLFRIALRRGRAVGVLATWLIVTLGVSGVVEGRESNRTLKLHFTHTGERGVFTYKRNGRYDPAVLKKLNHILRDWRRDEPTKMDPRLFDIIWEVYREVGGRDYIHIVSGYRSVKTNDMLRRRGRGAAKRSLHTRGQAMDFFIPGVPVSKVRKAGLRLQQGGVGYYPKSGSPFVHLDTGRVRHWPRMTRRQLAAVFPKGQTLHVPSDGKPLAGYETAKAKYRRKGAATVAYLDPKTRSIRPESETSGKKRATVANWLKRTIGGGADEEEDNILARPETTQVAAAGGPAPLPRELQADDRQTALAALGTPSDSAIAILVAGAAGQPSRDFASLDDRLQPALPVAQSRDRLKLARLMAQAALRAESDKADSKPAAIFSVAAGPAPAEKADFVADPVSGTAVDAANALGASAPENSTITIDTQNTVALAYASFGSDDALEPRKRPDPVELTNPRNRTRAGGPQYVAPAASAQEIEEIIDRELPVRLADVGDDADFSRFMGEKTTRTRLFAALEMPHPWAVPGLFKAPANVFAASRHQSGHTLRFDRFAKSGTDENKARGKSRLASIPDRRYPHRF